ncbi:MAG TPA: hypothetical protein VN224_04830 [Xanthomonadales bacterium]|nr:hypothetical protein [Xanthomonadales bacterium]
MLAKADAIGLTEAQKTSIQPMALRAQAHFVELQPRLAHAVQTMASLIGRNRVDEPRVFSQLDRVLSVEREIKRAQIGLMIHIKNVLTVEQQAKLRQLRAEAAPR